MDEPEEKTQEQTGEFLPKEQANVIFATSFLILFTAMYAFYKSYYDVAFMCILVFATSINHWRDPQFGFRRNVDMVAVIVGFAYLFVRAIMLGIQSILFWACFAAVGICFAGTWHLYHQGHVWMSTLVHCILHLFGNSAVWIYCSFL